MRLGHVTDIHSACVVLQIWPFYRLHPIVTRFTNASTRYLAISGKPETEQYVGGPVGAPASQPRPQTGDASDLRR
jgi:hypothetical protein